MKIYNPTQELSELAQSVFEATNQMAATANVVDGFTVWSQPLWKDLAEGGWLDVLADALRADVSPRDVREALDGVAGFETNRIPGPLATSIGFVSPLLHALDRRWLLSRMTAGEVFATAWMNGTLKDGVLRGTAEPVSGARHASVLIVVTESDSGQRIVAVVEKSQSGITVAPLDGLNLAAEADRVTFDNVQIGAGDVLTDGHDDAQLVDSVHGLYSLVLSTFAVGGAEALLQRTIAYVQERKQFGVPIGSFQAVKHMVADMKVELECSRSIIHIGSDALVNRSESLAADIAAARVHSATMYRRVSELAIQCHGGFGYTWEQGLHFYYKSALYNALLPTPPADQRRIIADHLKLSATTERVS